MNTNERLRTAGEYVEQLRLAIHEKELPATDRVRAAAPCLAIAQDHHHAIVILIEHHLFASSFALLRVAFEAYIRGEWLAHCAKDAQIQQFLDCTTDPPKINILLKELESTPAFVDQVLSKLKSRLWSSMCAYTHTGGLHVRRWNTAEAVEPTYAQEEIDEVLLLTEVIASLAAIGVAGLAADEKLAIEILEYFKLRTE
jgi:hypothetical protein